MCQPGAAIAPGRLPGRLAGFGHFPQHEIERVFFGLVDINALTGLQVSQVFAGQLAVRLELADRVKHVAIRANISQVFGN